MKKLKYIISIIISVILLTSICSADWTKEDIKVNTNIVLPDAVLQICNDINKSGKGYLIVRADKDTKFRVTNPNVSHGAFPYLDISVDSSNFVVFDYDSSFKIIDSTLTFSNWFLFDSNGNLIRSANTRFNYPFFTLTDYSYIATNKGLYNSAGNLLFYSSALPLGQATYLSHGSIIAELIYLFALLLPVLLFYIAIRKVISFVLGVTSRA